MNTKGFTKEQILKAAKAAGYNNSPTEGIVSYLNKDSSAIDKFKDALTGTLSLSDGGDVETEAQAQIQPYSKPSQRQKERAQLAGRGADWLTSRANNMQEKLRQAEQAGDVHSANYFRNTLADTDQALATAKATQPDTAKINIQPNQFMREGVGNIDPTTGQISETNTPENVQNPGAKGYEASSVSGLVEELSGRKDTTKGEVSEGSQVDAATMDPNQLAALKLEAAQIEEAREVNEPEERKLKQGELVDGSGVSQSKVDNALQNFKAVTGGPSQDALVQGQLSRLYKDFEDGKIPPWAAGAMRQAQETLAQRGLGASSIAGQAVVQAAMESATSIAKIDAATYSQFERENLNRRQQAKMLAAEQRARFLGQEFDQEFQSKVLNAAKISDIANRNHDTSVQIALENARIAQSVDIANLNASNAKVLADAAAMSQADLSNLNNRQQSRVFNAQAFLETDLKNLSATQQSELIEFQAIADSLLSDQAAKNAAAQFGAASENDINKFFSQLATNIDIARSQMLNTTDQFNAKMLDSRTKFNAENALEIERANTEWRRRVAEVNTAAQNATNQLNASIVANRSNLGFEALVQLERDEMDFLNDAFNRAFTSDQNERNRKNEIIKATIQRDMRMDLAEDDRWFEAAQAAGGAAVNILNSDFGSSIVGGIGDFIGGFF